MAQGSRMDIRLLLLSVTTLALAGCVPSPDQLPSPIKVGSKLQAQYLAANADQPYGLAAAKDGRVFYSEKSTGRIRVIENGALLADSFAQVPVNSAGDGGLLGLALHPDFEHNQRIYAFYTRSDTGQSTSDPQAVIDNRVVYFEAEGNVAAGGEVFVVSLPAGPETSRVGGRLAFDQAGKLLVALGDQGDDSAGQSDDFVGGKILRYNDDGTIPDDNPTAGSAILAKGIRNVLGLTIDPVSRVAFALDNNDGPGNEVDRPSAAGNLGWSAVAGAADTPEEQEFVDNTPTYIAPTFISEDSRGLIVGGSFNPSTKYDPNQLNQFFYAEAVQRRIMRLTLSPDRLTVTGRFTFASGFPSNINDAVFTPAGTLYVTCDTAVFRINAVP